MKRDIGEGPFTAHNWTEDRYMRRIHGAAEDRAQAEGRPFCDLADVTRLNASQSSVDHLAKPDETPQFP